MFGNFCSLKAVVMVMLYSDLIYDFLIMLSKRLLEIDVSTILTILQCKSLILFCSAVVASMKFRHISSNWVSVRIPFLH